MGMEMFSDKMIYDLEAPFYLYDSGALKARCDLIRRSLEGIGLCYAMKASPALCGLLSDYVDRIEVCSPGEYEICRRAGIDPAGILVSGVNKTYESMDRILSLGGEKGSFTIESPMHLVILKELSEKYQRRLRCYIRLSGGNQFGSDEDTVISLAGQVTEAPYLDFCGIHYYAGTQKSLKKAERELIFLRDFAKKIKLIYNTELGLEYGPGLAVDCFNPAGETAKDIGAPFEKEKNEAGELLAGLCGLIRETGLRDVYEEITFEYGRFIAACGGIYVTGVNDVKKNDGVSYVIADGGIHQLNYFGSMAGMKTPWVYVCSDPFGKTDGGPVPDSPEVTQAQMQYVVAGSLCSANDIMVRSLKAVKISRMDRLVFCLAGAYSVTEGSALFLSRDLPAVYLAEADGIKVIRGRSETSGLNDGTW